MTELVNTVDIVGDEELTRSIIDRSITEFVDDRLTNIGKFAFRKCESLTKVILPKVTTISENAFYDDEQLNILELPMVRDIGLSAFNGCDALTEINLTLQNKLNVGRYAFQSCTGLTKVKVSAENDNGDIYFDNASFYWCPSLNTVDCCSMASISKEAFRACSALQAFILRSNRISKLSNIDAFKKTPIESGTGYIYVPAALVDSYKSATNWSTYASQFRALEDYTVDGTTTGELDPTKI